MSELHDRVRAWIADEVDPAAATELQALLDAGEDAELADRFAAPLAFGTAGLRGPLRAGPNGMNRAVVRRTAAGLAAWLTAEGRRGEPIVIGYDARHGSHDFAHDSAAIFAAAGFDAQLLPGLLPTPILAFAVQYLHAAAGVMVTASHNPPQDNGYKVYASDGAQIVPPTDTQIEAAIESVGSVRDIPLDESTVTHLGPELADAYVDAVVGLIGVGPRDLRIVHTAMHGVGTETLRRVLAAAGFLDVIPVPQQERPDPDFPTVSFPNPEEPGALDLALDLARRTDADVVIANDPDADRCAVAVPQPDGAWRMLRGDEVGVLLGAALLDRGVTGTYATTIVSSSMLGALAVKHGVGYAETLTGFKWISRAAPDLVYGYEEALGYAVAPALVRDKDGISAALRVADLAAVLKANCSSLLTRLDELAAEYGRYATDQVSVRVEEISEIAEMMRRLRADPPTTLLGAQVQVEDLLPDADVVRWRWSGQPGGRVVVRPSGTEPKLKAYLEIVQPDGDAAQANDALAQLRGEISALL
jgi:phosphomannomutase